MTYRSLASSVNDNIVLCAHGHGFSRAFFFFFNDTATTEIYTLSLHDALPICVREAGDLHVLERAERGERRGDLERAAHAARPDRVRREPQDLLPAVRDRAVVGAEQAGQDVEERRLAGAVRADERADLAARQVEAHAVDRTDTAERLTDVDDPEQRLRHDGLRPRQEFRAGRPARAGSGWRRARAASTPCTSSPPCRGACRSPPPLARPPAPARRRAAPSRAAPPTSAPPGGWGTRCPSGTRTCPRRRRRRTPRRRTPSTGGAGC